MEHFNGILFHKSGPANQYHTNLSINSSWILSYPDNWVVINITVVLSYTVGESGIVFLIKRMKIALTFLENLLLPEFCSSTFFSQNEELI
jgi:hypothetical protein